jgi:membrane-associated phospholipid phosphatase
MVRRENLKWELPIAAAAVVLIGTVDSHVSNQVRAGSYNTASDNASNILIGSQLGLGVLAYGIGCAGYSSRARRTAFTALEAAGYGLVADLALKAAFNREYPNKFNGDGRFWHGGKSFPSAHAATTWAFASALAHQYPRNRLVKWSAYGAATGISVLRLTAHKHFPSDILVGATLGYVTGSYIGSR